MNVRGGNAYIEEWPNARLLRDSYLGAIWEGSTNVVALDVQRAVLRDQALDALAGFVTARIDGLATPLAKPWSDAVRAALDDVARRTRAWPALPAHDRERQARPAADRLYHALVTSLLLAEGDRLLARAGDARKLLVAALYARKWLGRDDELTPWAAVQQLDALVDWTPVAPETLAALVPMV
jgi:acyl-CoA dehydrogenase